MSDEKLRELERLWKETGAIEDEASYLRERVRVGDLARKRLELAASCGHEAARLVIGSPAFDLAEAGHFGLAAMLASLDREPQPIPVLAALACASLAVSRWETRPRAELAPRAALKAARQWLVEPSEARQRQAWEAGCQACDLATPFVDIAYRSAAWCAAMPALLTADMTARLRLLSESPRNTIGMGHNLGLVSILRSCSVTEAAKHARGAGITEVEVGAAVRADVCRWALQDGSTTEAADEVTA